MSPSEQTFQSFLEKNPQLCASGLVGPDLCRQLQLDFENERQRLRAAFNDFAFCCDWLLDSTPMRRVSCVAPTSSELIIRVAKKLGTPVCHGALVAAILFLRIPHYQPDGSPDVRVGISIRSPTLNDAAKGPG